MPCRHLRALAPLTFSLMFACAAAAAGQPATQASSEVTTADMPGLLPVSDFARHAVLKDPRLSPDGEHLLVRVDGASGRKRGGGNQPENLPAEIFRRSGRKPLQTFSNYAKCITDMSRSKHGSGKREDTYEDVFIALAHPVRRRILLTMNFKGGSMSAGEIAETFEHAWPTTTRHMQVLESAGLLSHERQGRNRIYHMERKRLELARDWLDWFSKGQADGE